MCLPDPGGEGGDVMGVTTPPFGLEYKLLIGM